MQKKGWKKRIGAMFMAFVMVFTTVMASGIGQTVAEAGENESFTLYFYSESTEPLYVNIWNWTGVKFAEDVATDNVFGWDLKQATMQAVGGNEKWYSVKFDIVDASANDGFTIYAGNFDSKVIEYDNQWNNTEKYNAMMSGEYSAYAIKGDTLYTDLTEAGLETEESQKDQIVIKPSVTTIEAGGSVDLTASVKYNGKDITDLGATEYKLSWWVDSWKDHSDGNSDAIVDKNTKYSLATSVQLPSAGTYYIVCELDTSNWTKLLSECVTITVTEPENPTAVEGDLNITKVNHLPEDFIMGMDISSVIAEFESGVTYRDYDGKVIDNVTDFCKFLAENGITHIRVRVWNNPYDSNGNGYGGGNNDVAKAKQIADACGAAGIKMLVDFHCSDLWTDPGKQQAPKSWKNYTLEQKEEALQAFITESLNTIDPDKDTVAMVQVGNETTSGFVGETTETNMCKLFSAGAVGVRAYNENVKIVIHETNPEKGNITKWAKILNANNVDYDILATSYYPYWHGTLDNLKSEFEIVKATYGKDVMVAETSYAYTLNDSDGHDNTVRVGNNDTGGNTTEPFTEQGQATAIRNLIEAVNNAGGLGVFYWEPAWLTVGDTTGLTGNAYDAQVAANKEKWEKYGSGWASSYAGEYDAKDAGKWYGGTAVDNEAMFYPDGTPTPGLHVWNYVKTGAVNKEVGVDSVGTSAQLSKTIKVGEENCLPQTVTVAYTSGSVDENVIWNQNDLCNIRLEQPGTYQVSGIVSFSKQITQGTYKGKSTANVIYRLKVLPANLITDAEDAGFEKGENFSIEGTGISNIPANDDPYEGSHSMHWYSEKAATGTVVYKKAITLDKGSYMFEAVAQGAATDQVTLNILDEDGEPLFEGKPQVLDGWKNWKTPVVVFTLNKKTAVKLEIQIVIADGGWGTADNLYLHKEGVSVSKDPSPGAPSTGNSTTTANQDSTVTETKTETIKNEAGNKVEVTTTTHKDADGKVIGTTETSVIDGILKNETATVTVVKDVSGNVTSAEAEMTKTGSASKKDVTATISRTAVSQIVEAAGGVSVEISMIVTAGNQEYTVKMDSEDLMAGKKLKVLAIDPETGEYVLVNAKIYTVSKSGNVNLTLESGKNYELLDTKEAATVEKEILNTVKVKKKAATVKSGKSTKIQISGKLNMDNVEKITYSSSKKSIATVNKSGKVTTKKAGSVTIKAKVTLNNGKTKTVTMKIKVKK